MNKKTFAELGLSPELLKAIDKLGFEQPAPIQAAAIPPIRAGLDIVGQSQTGSGKTAAFAIPAIEAVDTLKKAVQILILCPTRELAIQVAEEVHKLSLFKRGIHALPIYGGQSYDRQILGLRQGAQIVIGTPGRVMDHMRRGTLRLDAVKMVVLDEADEMLDMGFREDIEFVLQAVPVERQTVFFSATMPRAIQELIGKYAKNPQTVRIEQQAMTVPTVEQSYYEVDRRVKVELLTRLIDLHDIKLGIIFCNTKRMVDDLVDHLNARGYSADRLHGDMSQAMRDRVMGKFRKSGLEFLVATDVAARGIDVDDVEVVFNYDLPYDGEDYVHRIGRTGRAGRSGRAISFVAGREVFQIQHIERFTRTKIRRDRIPTVAEVESKKTEAFVEKLRGMLKSGEFKKHDHLIERLMEEGFSSTDIASALLSQLFAGDSRPAEAAPARPVREARAPLSVAPASAVPVPAKPFSPPTRPSAPTTVRPIRENREEAPFRERREPREFKRTDARPFIPTNRKAGMDRGVAAPVRPPATRPVFSTGPAVRPEMQRLIMNLGSEAGVAPKDIVGAILGETGLPPHVVGAIQIEGDHLFVEVAAEHSEQIMRKLERTRIKGQRPEIGLAHPIRRPARAEWKKK